jgi:hypothetical protein
MVFWRSVVRLVPALFDVHVHMLSAMGPGKPGFFPDGQTLCRRHQGPDFLLGPFAITCSIMEPYWSIHSPHGETERWQTLSQWRRWTSWPQVTR